MNNIERRDAQLPYVADESVLQEIHAGSLRKLKKKTKGIISETGSLMRKHGKTWGIDCI